MITKIDKLETKIKIVLKKMKGSRDIKLEKGLLELKEGKGKLYKSLHEWEADMKSQSGVLRAYNLFQTESVTDSIKELEKKDIVLLKQLKKKIAQILENPYGVGKWMRGNYGGVREVHILGKRFVLMYTIDESKKQVNLVKFDHHPKKY